jgi:hypothetical protein
MVTDPSNNSNLDPLDEAINLFYKSKNTTSRVPSCNITQFVPIIYQREVRHYVPTVIVGTYTNWDTLILHLHLLLVHI